jgi:hypothetical protein
MFTHETVYCIVHSDVWQIRSKGEKKHNHLIWKLAVTMTTKYILYTLPEFQVSKEFEI